MLDAADNVRAVGRLRVPVLSLREQLSVCAVEETQRHRRRTEVDCRARVDWLREDMIVDLKTARYGSGTADAFGRYAASYNYPLPAAVYTEAVEALTGKTLPFITVTVETEPPYLVRAYRYTDADLDQGRAQWHEALREYAARDAANDWTVPAEIELIALPAWYAPLEDLEF